MTGRPKSSRLPSVAPSAGEATNPGDRCATPGCGHVIVLHDLPRGKRTRTACTVSSGHRATPCGCRRFTTPQTEETTP